MKKLIIMLTLKDGSTLFDTNGNGLSGRAQDAHQMTLVDALHRLGVVGTHPQLAVATLTVVEEVEVAVG